MAEPQIPPPDAGGYWHFLYITRDTDGRWYGGKRSTKKHPSLDPYLGSGNFIRAHPARHRLKREVVAFFPSSKAVFAAEAELVTWAVIMGDALCMNECEGGKGLSVEYARMRAADPNWQPIKLKALVKRSANPKWRESNAAANRRRAEDPELRAVQAAGCRKRSAVPEWLEANTASARRLAKEPGWQQAHALSMAKMKADPEWAASHRLGIAIRGANPIWRANVGVRGAAFLRRQAAKPGWREERIAENKRMAADPKWQEAVAVGLTKRNANPVWKANVGASNRARSTIFVNVNGLRLSLYDACRAAGISYNTAYARQQRGLPESQWLTPPTQRRTAR